MNLATIPSIPLGFCAASLQTQIRKNTFSAAYSSADLTLKAGPHYIELFNQISLHVCSLVPAPSSEPSSKKRRLDEELTSRPASNGTNGFAKPALSTTGTGAASGKDPVLLELKDISLVIPQRKKYTLCFTSSHLYARLPDSKEPVAGTSYAWSDIGIYIVQSSGNSNTNSTKTTPSVSPSQKRHKSNSTTSSFPKIP